jgi:hypothetical protein
MRLINNLQVAVKMLFTDNLNAKLLSDLRKEVDLLWYVSLYMHVPFGTGLFPARKYLSRLNGGMQNTSPLWNKCDKREKRKDYFHGYENSPVPQPFPF